MQTSFRLAFCARFLPSIAALGRQPRFAKTCLAQQHARGRPARCRTHRMPLARTLRRCRRPHAGCRRGKPFGASGLERAHLLPVAGAVLVALALAVVRALKEPTVFDRVLAGNSVGTLAILLLAVVGFLTGRPEWLDIAITYGLLNVISTLAILKFFRHGDLAYDAAEEEQR